MTYNYKLKNRNNRVVYIGVSKAPRRRAEEHRASDKKFAKIDIGRNLPRKQAERNETRQMKNFIVRHGRKPKYNKTKDGK